MTLRWQLNAQNKIKFVMVNSSNVEVTGLGTGYTLEVAKSGASSFASSAGTKTEIASGWYQYVATAAESDTPGEIAVKVTGSGVVQQNLVYQVGSEAHGFGSIAHTIQIIVDGTPIDGAEVWITTDIAGAELVAGTLATNSQGNVTFYLDAGGYYAWVQHGQHNFTNPSAITVS